MTNKSKAIVDLAYNKAHFIKFNEKVCKTYNSDVAILLAIFMELENYFESNIKYDSFLKRSSGYFYCMAKYVNERNGMSPDRMRRAVKLMEEAKMISTKKWAKNWKLYKLNHETLSKLFLNISLDSIENRKEKDSNFHEKLNELDSIFQDLEALK